MKYIAILVAFVATNCLYAQEQSPCRMKPFTEPIYTEPSDVTVEPVAEVYVPIGVPFTPPPPPTPTAENVRTIYFLHGLGGNSGSWSKPSTDVGLRYKALAPTPEYVNHDFSLETAAHTVYTDHIYPYLTPSVDRSNDFMIAHSQGGLVARQLEMRQRVGPNGGTAPYNQVIGGLATFGSPHGGARILNNRAMLEQFATGACGLIKGPLSNVIDPDGALAQLAVNFMGLQQTLGSATDLLCEFVGQDITPFVLSDFDAPITEDYFVGADAVETLNDNGNPNLPSVAFFGVEDQPVFWRTAQHLVTSSSESDLWEADEDETLLNNINEMTNEYLTEFTAARNAVTSMEDTWGLSFLSRKCQVYEWFLLGPAICTTREIVVDDYQDKKEKRDAWGAGWNWLSTANEQWRVIIGEREPISEAACRCVYTDENGNTSTFNEPGGDCDQYETGGGHPAVGQEFTICHPTILNTWINRESDGIVLSESASATGLPFAPQFKIRMPGSNHQQMRNDPNTEEQFRILLNPNIGGSYGDYFKTPLR